jgi:NTE family protein
MTETKYGLILSGGGAYAAYEIGVIKALFSGQSPATGYSPLDPMVVSGTSAGALNASLLISMARESCSAAVGQMEDVWLDDVADIPGKCGNGVFQFRINLVDFFKPACYFPNPFRPFLELAQNSAFLAQDFLKRGVQFVSSSSLDMQQRALELVNVGAFASIDRFTHLLHKVLRLENIRASPRKLRVAATNWKTGALKVFTNEDMGDDVGYPIIQASSAIPGLFPRVEIENEPYVDGGLVMNTPLKPAIDAGAESLHIVYMDPDLAQIPLPRLANTPNDLYRSLTIQFAATLKRDLELAARVNRAVYAGAASFPATRSVGLQSSAVATLMRGADGEFHRALPMHLYHPSGPLGGGWLSFEQDHLDQLIDRGFADAVAHDCRVNKCLLPDSL